MGHPKIHITTDAGESVQAIAPVIISASRSTDIPAFYGDWFVERWKKGYVKWHNPYSGKPVYVSFQNARAVIFWSKNPEPFMKHLPFLMEHIPNFYFQFTLNDYDLEKYEPNVPEVDTRIETFKELAREIGKERVIWRFDPLLLTHTITVDTLLRRINYIGNQLQKSTNKLVFSFADISIYKRVEKNLQLANVKYEEFSEATRLQFAKGLQDLNQKWNFDLASCAEDINLEEFGITHNKCIDDDLMIKLFNHDKSLLSFLGVNTQRPSLFPEDFQTQTRKNLKDKGQRKLCKCIISKDIGQYNTCPHACVYCYANASKQQAIKNYQMHMKNPLSESINGE